ncbi:helix-turn-helix transcriptional regulator [Micromonospora sp. STR1s_5]|nr:helix-turn-helix transcriptional regulator [Micromonospora sp. STR1s_5]
MEGTHPDEMFARRLNHLFKTKRRPDGELWENSDVVERCDLSRQQIHNLRNPSGSDRSKGPTWKTINALAEVFGVDPNFFFQPLALPAEPAPTAPDELTSRLADLGVTHVAAYQVGQDLQAVKATVLQVLDQIARIEKQMGGNAAPAE